MHDGGLTDMVIICRLESCTHALFRRRWKALEETSATVPDLLRFRVGLGSKDP